MGRRLAGVVLGLVVLAGCARGGSSNESSSGAGDTGSEAVAGPQSLAAAGELGALPPAPRQVVSTAAVTLEADDVAQAKNAVVAAGAAAGGVLFSETAQFGDDARATVTLKVPPDQFQSVLSTLGTAGTVTTQEVDTEDVTDQVVDLDARIATARASVDRLRGFLDRATNVAEIATLEAELLARETELERLVGQRRTLEGRVDMATVVVTILAPTTLVAADGLPGFLDGLRGGWEAFMVAATITLAALGALAPFLPLLIGVALGVRWSARRRARQVVTTDT